MKKSSIVVAGRRLAVLCLCALAACQRDLPPLPQEGVVAGPPSSSGDAMAVRPRVLALERVPEGTPEQGGIASQLCNLDGLGEANFGAEPLVFRAEAPALARGWLGMDASARAPDSAVLRFDSLERPGEAWQVAVVIDGSREDVAAARRAPGLAASGLDSALDLSRLPAGSYRYYATYQGDGQAYVCDVGRIVEVRK